MERDVGIEGYLTSTPGVGGTTKASADDFIVEEVSSPPPKSADGPYAIATIRVRNWETNRLVREFARTLHISRRRIGFGGTKDKRALTTQLFSFENVPVETLSALRMKDVEVLDAYPSDRPLEIGELIGNRFRVLGRGLRRKSEPGRGPGVLRDPRGLARHGGHPGGPPRLSEVVRLREGDPEPSGDPSGRCRRGAAAAAVQPPLDVRARLPVVPVQPD